MPGPSWISEEPLSKQDAVNRRTYSSSRLVRQYARRDLQPAETAVFERFAADFAAARLLELGCAGRITQRLIELGARVVGVDVSPAMIAHCELTLPGATFLVTDLPVVAQPELVRRARRGEERPEAAVDGEPLLARTRNDPLPPRAT